MGGHELLTCGLQLDGNVRFGSLADNKARIGDVRFTPESRHCLAWLRCPLSAKSGQLCLAHTSLRVPHASEFVRAHTQIVWGSQNQSTLRLQPIRALPERPSLRTQVTLLPWRVSL